MNYRGCVIQTLIGGLLIQVDPNGALARLDFLRNREAAAVVADHAEQGHAFEEDEVATYEVARQLAEYFAGERELFQLNLAPRGTPFQMRVWAELQRIPYGTCCSYGQIAERLGNPKAVRAVGTANGRNPIPIIIPCHRVIGANGKMVGFSGGMQLKIELLQHERYLLPM